jgi:hypothetical protein
MQLLTTSPYLSLYLHRGPSRAIEAQWKGVADSMLLRRAALECVTLTREHGISRWIAADRLLGPVNLEWTATYVLPLLVKLGLQRFARPEAVDPLSQGLLTLTQETATQRLPFALRFFTNVWAARIWVCG